VCESWVPLNSPWALSTSAADCRWVPPGTCEEEEMKKMTTIATKAKRMYLKYFVEPAMALALALALGASAASWR
jgi:hypothetical protein